VAEITASGWQKLDLIMEVASSEKTFDCQNTFRLTSVSRTGEIGPIDTFQGEGPSVGKPVVFVRLHGCNFTCQWCDTAYTWNEQDPDYEKQKDFSLNELETAIRVAIAEQDYKTQTLVFTGGEPMLQQKQIVRFLNQYTNYSAEIETNGSVLPQAELQRLIRQNRVRINCSPKLGNSGQPENRRYKPRVLQALAQFETTIFKFVCQTPADLEEIEDKFIHPSQLGGSQTGLGITPSKVFIMAEGATLANQNSRLDGHFIQAVRKKGFNLTPRAHLAWGVE
jgi:7-carboxy-7-deazaguanine synthase